MSAPPRGALADDPALAVAGPAILTPMRWWELAEIQDLERRLFPLDPWTPGQFWSELARVPELRWYVVARQPGDSGAAGEVADPIIGYAGLNVIGPEADVQTVAVAPERQGAGVGRQLVTALIAAAQHRGAGQLHLEVRADNLAALRLYRRLGFTSDGRRRGYYGAGQDAELMTLRTGSRTATTEEQAHG